MIWPNKFKILFKTISANVAGIFLWNQLVWAGDLIDPILQNQYDEQAQTFAPDYLQTSRES